MSSLGAAEIWLDERRRAFGLEVLPTTLSQCAQWHLVDGELRHDSGRFFQVVGGRASTPSGEPWEQPLLRQEEVGLLAYLVRRREAGHEWLLQAKSEPGNVGITQIAPTIQATESNFQRVHGGAATRFLEWFEHDTDEHVLADVLASEIGTRFLRKRNRNAVALVPHGREVELGGAWQWFGGDQVRRLLARDYVVGTEARSVIVSAPWSLIGDGSPFARRLGRRGFGARLAASYTTEADITAVLADLEMGRGSAPAGATELPLESLQGWRVTNRGIVPRQRGDVSVRYVSVAARDREVGEWSQPLMARIPIESCDLVCQVRDGVLRFLLRLAWEPGLAGLVELAPTRLGNGPVSAERSSDEQTRLRLLQSDEGGRFLNCRTRYRIVERRSNDAEPPRPGEHWLTLAQLEALASRPTTLSNETRTALSLLLSLA